MSRSAGAADAAACVTRLGAVGLGHICVCVGICLANTLMKQSVTVAFVLLRDFLLSACSFFRPSFSPCIMVLRGVASAARPIMCCLLPPGGCHFLLAIELLGVLAHVASDSVNFDKQNVWRCEE